MRDEGAPAIVTALTAAVAHERLEAATLRALASAVRSDDAALRAAFAALFTRLRASDARSRVRAVLLADYLFVRSKLFRELLSSRLPVRWRSLLCSPALTPTTYTCACLLRRTLWPPRWARWARRRCRSRE